MHSDKEAMKLVCDIVFYAYKHPENTFEASVDRYLKEFVHSKEVLETVNSTKVLPTYLNVAYLTYQSLPLKKYIQDHCIQDFYDKQEATACIRSIQHYLFKNKVEEHAVEEWIGRYFTHDYYKFLRTYLINHYTYHGVKLDMIIKYYLPEEMHGKDRVFLYKNKWLGYVEQNYDKKKKTLNFSLDRCMEYYIRKVFNKDLSGDILDIFHYNIMKQQNRKR